jgi:hypothetical protein
MKKYKCCNCEHCNIAKKKCYPQSKDCEKEYTLTDDDINNYSTKRCDFYKPKNNKCMNARALSK